MGLIDGMLRRLKEALKLAVYAEVDVLARDLCADLESKLGQAWNPMQCVLLHTERLKGRISRL